MSPLDPQAPRNGISGRSRRDLAQQTSAYVEATIGEQQSECPCPAPNVQHLVGAELASELRVHIKIAAVGIERVVDGDQAWLLEDVIDHAIDHRHRDRTA